MSLVSRIFHSPKTSFFTLALNKSLVFNIPACEGNTDITFNIPISTIFSSQPSSKTLFVLGVLRDSGIDFHFHGLIKD